MDNNPTLFKVMPGGPLKVTGPFRLKGLGAKIIEKDEPVLLCRCGDSSNKPFCDNSHERNGFSE